MKKFLACLLGLLLVVGVTVSLSHYAWAKEGAKAGTAGVKAPEKAPPVTAPAKEGTAGVKQPPKTAPATAPKEGAAGMRTPEKTPAPAAPAKGAPVDVKAPERR